MKGDSRSKLINLAFPQVSKYLGLLIQFFGKRELYLKKRLDIEIGVSELLSKIFSQVPRGPGRVPLHLLHPQPLSDLPRQILVS